MAEGTCRALHILHSANMVHRDVRAANHVWADVTKQRIVLIDCTDAGPAGRCPDPSLLTKRKGWSNPFGGTDLLEDNGEFSERSDMHMAGAMLLQYFRLLQHNMLDFCQKLERKELSASQALTALRYLRSLP